MEIDTANVDKEPVILQILRIKVYFFYLRFIEWLAFRGFQAFSEFCGIKPPKGEKRPKIAFASMIIITNIMPKKPGLGPDFV